jgi:TonB family protein
MKSMMMPAMAGLLMASIAIASAAPPSDTQPASDAGHALSAKTEALLARDARRLLATPGVNHVGFYGFTVDRAGHVLSEWVVRPSGSAMLDRMALATIGKAMLKRLPANAPPTMRFIIPIAFHNNGKMSEPAG